MTYELFGISTSTSKRDIDWLGLNEDITIDNTSTLSSSQDIEERSLTGTGCSHEGSEGTRFNVTVNIIKQLSVTSRYRDGIIQSLPSEWNILLLQCR